MADLDKKVKDRIDFFRELGKSFRKIHIVDVGASPFGTPPYQQLLQEGFCRVYGFEPNESQYVKLQASKSEHEHYFPNAVGLNARKTLRIFRLPGFTSIFEPDRENMNLLGMPHWHRIDSQIEMDTVALDDVAGLEHCDLLKIDIQGGEVDVFRGGRSTMKECVAVVTEVRYLSLYHDEPMFRGVDAELSEQGFTLHKFDFNKSTAIGNSQTEKLRPRRMGDQLIDGDAVYIRDLKGIRGWTDVQVFSLATLSGTVFGSNSLALHCLDELVRRAVVPTDTPARYVPLLPDDQVRREYRS